MNKEYFDILDENGNKTGKILSRDEVHKKGLWHRAIIVAIINENNEILIQKRSKNKDKNANMWDISVAGHISSGEESLLAAKREIEEEVSIKNINDLRYIFSYKKEQIFPNGFIEKQIYDFYILKVRNLTIKDIKYQESEVQEIKFCSIKEIKQLISSGQFVDRKEIYGEIENYI